MLLFEASVLASFPPLSHLVFPLPLYLKQRSEPSLDTLQPLSLCSKTGPFTVLSEWALLDGNLNA